MAHFKVALGICILSKTSNQQCTFKWMPLTSLSHAFKHIHVSVYHSTKSKVKLICYVWKACWALVYFPCNFKMSKYATPSVHTTQHLAD